jgi:hypothetical protein
MRTTTSASPRKLLACDCVVNGCFDVSCSQLNRWSSTMMNAPSVSECLQPIGVFRARTGCLETLRQCATPPGHRKAQQVTQHATYFRAPALVVRVQPSRSK